MNHEIKSFKDACKKLGLDPAKSLPDVSTLPEEMQKPIIAHCALVIIAKALNEGWVPDWTNSNEYKYYPWFDMSSGVGLSYYGYVISYSCTSVRSRLVFKNYDLAKYAGTQFEFLYKEYMVIAK